MQNIHEYIKHLTRDFRQKKAKSEAFDKLSESVGFWHKDFCEKIIPLKFREDKKEYFGKKGWAFMLISWFIRSDKHRWKNRFISLPYIYRCDYSTADIAVIADVVLGQFRMDVPGVIHKFRLLSGEPLSWGNIDPMQTKRIKLLNYDCNKPCCGKNQCYHGSTAAKRIIRSFIDSGNDLLDRSSIFSRHCIMLMGWKVLR